MKTFDLMIVGGGSAGLAVAGGAARMGIEVGLVEKEKLGGDCLHYGCVPSKALLHAAKVISCLREGRTFGLDVPKGLPDFGKIMDYGRQVQAVLGKHDAPERFEEMGVRVIFGKPRFVSPTEMEIDGRKLGSKRFVIATGSRVRVLPIPGLEEVGYITNVEVFGLRELPESLVILGGGPVAIEMSQAFARLGSRVTVLEKMAQILPREEPEAAQALQEILEGEGITFHTGIEIKRLEKQEGEKVVFLEKAGKEIRVQGKEVLAALGRSPAIEGLNLEDAGVQFTEKGITVNVTLRTTAKKIWACGDCIGGYLFTHTAEYEAGIVVRNALSPLRKKVDYGVVPWATFTDPELAHVGLMEAEAKRRNIPYVTYSLPFKDVDRAHTDGETEGMAKIICDRKGRILGATILGSQAGEMIHEWALAMKAKVPIGKIAGTIHIYPTLSRLNRKVADRYYEKVFPGTTGKILKWLANR